MEDSGILFLIYSVHREINHSHYKTEAATSFRPTSCNCYSNTWQYTTSQLKKSIHQHELLDCSCSSPHLPVSTYCDSRSFYFHFSSGFSLIYYFCYLIRNSLSIFVTEIRQNRKGKLLIIIKMWSSMTVY